MTAMRDRPHRVERAMKQLMTLGAPKAGQTDSSKDPKSQKIPIYIFPYRVHIICHMSTMTNDYILDERFCGSTDSIWTSLKLGWCWISFCSHQKVNVLQQIGWQKYQVRFNPS